MPGSFPFSTSPNPDDGYDAPHASHEELEQYVEQSDELPPVDEQFANEPDIPVGAQFIAATNDQEQQTEAIQEGRETLVSPEAQLPPEAQGETNGGPLGCCLGVTVGLMLSIFLGVIGLSHLLLLPFLLFFHADPLTGIRIATGFFGLIGVIAGGYFGWKIGKRVYREYELSPRQKQRLAYLEKRHARR
jgi:hypothetical protein